MRRSHIQPRCKHTTHLDEPADRTLSEGSRSQRFRLHEVLRAGTPRETESRPPVGQEGGDGSRGQTVSGYRVCFKGDKNVPELLVVMAEQPRNLLKMRCIQPFVSTAWYANYISNCPGKESKQRLGSRKF